jgi:hypothetical protein
VGSFEYDAFGNLTLMALGAETHRITTTGCACAVSSTDRTVRGGTMVTLDGTASSDVDGSITAYAWQQTAGTPVTITGADRATASFSSPPLSAEETLTFTLTVTDDGGRARRTVYR